MSVLKEIKLLELKMKPCENRKKKEADFLAYLERNEKKRKGGSGCAPRRPRV